MELKRYESNKLKLSMQIEEKSLLTDKHRTFKDENAWRYSIRGIKQKIKVVDPNVIYEEARKPPTEEEKDRSYHNLRLRI
jgi:hypothetical protein